MQKMDGERKERETDRQRERSGAECHLHTTLDPCRKYIISPILPSHAPFQKINPEKATIAQAATSAVHNSAISNYLR